MNICVIGGGLTGLALARKLANDGHSLTVIESSDQVGGLATWYDYGDFYWDKFYHVILPSDVHLIQFLRDLDLHDNLEWQRSYTGFFVDNVLHSISTNLEFLRFPLLSLLSKARLAWTMLYGSRINDWRRLEKITAVDWLSQVSGQSTYDKLWKPLLLAKLGPNYNRVSAVFIWSYIKRLFSARDKSANSEQLGHVNGGYKLILEKLVSDIRTFGGTVAVGTKVESIAPAAHEKLSVVADNIASEYDSVICTSPAPILRQIASKDLIRVDDPGADIEYLGVVCVVLVTRKPLCRFYVVNVADEELPFTGVIGMSSVVDSKHTAGRFITYLPKYILSDSTEFDRSDAEFEREFLSGLKKIFPDFDEQDIESVHINRARRVQPLQVLDYSRLVPQISTRHPGFFVLNTSQFVNATLNNNEVIRSVNEFYDRVSAAAISPVET